MASEERVDVGGEKEANLEETLLNQLDEPNEDGAEGSSRKREEGHSQDGSENDEAVTSSENRRLTSQVSTHDSEDDHVSSRSPLVTETSQDHSLDHDGEVDAYPEVSPRSQVVEATVKDFGSIGRCATVNSLLALEAGIFLTDMEQLSSSVLDDIVNYVVTSLNRVDVDPNMTVSDMASYVDRYSQADSKLTDVSKIPHSIAGIFDIRSVYDSFYDQFPFCFFITKLPDEVICVCFHGPGSIVVFDPVARTIDGKFETTGPYCFQQSSFIALLDYIKEIWPVNNNSPDECDYLYLTVAVRSSIKFENLPNLEENFSKLEVKHLSKRVSVLSEIVAMLQRNNAQLDSKVQQLEQLVMSMSLPKTEPPTPSQTEASTVNHSSPGSSCQHLPESNTNAVEEEVASGTNKTPRGDRAQDEKVLCALCLQHHALESVVELLPCYHRLCHDCASFYQQSQLFLPFYCPICQTKLNTNGHDEVLQ